MSRFFSFFLLVAGLSGCMPALRIPDYIKISDPHRTLIAETVSIGQQMVHKDQELTHYVVNSNHVYCSDLVTMNTSFYQCFELVDGYLIRGMNPLTFDLILLQVKIPVRLAAR